MYADDSNLLYAHANLDILVRLVNEDIAAISNYCTVNHLSLNAGKTKAMFFKPHKSIDYSKYQFHINNVAIEQVSTFKLLGLKIDSHLTFTDHVGHVLSKLTSANYLIFKLRYSIPKHVLLNLFSAVGMSHIYYNDIIYLNGCSGTSFNQIQSRYIDCGRLILFERKGTSRSLVL